MSKEAGMVANQLDNLSHHSHWSKKSILSEIEERKHMRVARITIYVSIAIVGVDFPRHGKVL